MAVARIARSTVKARGTVFALLLAACTSSPDGQKISLTLPETGTQSDSQTAVQREHARILASYGGVYENERLQSEIAKTVDSQPAFSNRSSSRTAGLNRSMWPACTGGAPAADAAARI